MNNYILKHKDINVLKFSFNDKYVIVKIIAVYNNEHKPVTILHNEVLSETDALSLTDHYWIMPEDKNITWHEINYYENKFSEDVGKVLLDNTYNIKDVNIFSPGNSSDGKLKKKKWYKSLNKRWRYIFSTGILQ